MYTIEEFNIKVMESVLLKQYENIANETNEERAVSLEDTKDTMITTLLIMGYEVKLDVDTDLKVTAVHVRKV